MDARRLLLDFVATHFDALIAPEGFESSSGVSSGAVELHARSMGRE
jgi:hypothetical protein